MRYLFTAITALLMLSVSAQTYTARQLYDEYHANSYNFENKYFNKTLTITGKIRSVTAGHRPLNEYNVALLTATGYENFVICQFPIDDTETLSRLNAGETVTVTGNYTQQARDAVFLKNCTFGKSAAAAPAAQKKVSAQIPLGTYHVYQANGATFNYQYKLSLSSYSNYAVNGQNGNCVYDTKSKVIRFTSGKFKGFTGLYRPVNPDNEKDPPTIVIDFTGKVPDLAHQYGKTYMLAYLQP